MFCIFQMFWFSFVVPVSFFSLLHSLDLSSFSWHAFATHPTFYLPPLIGLPLSFSLLRPCPPLSSWLSSVFLHSAGSQQGLVARGNLYSRHINSRGFGLLLEKQQSTFKLPGKVLWRNSVCVRHCRSKTDRNPIQLYCRFQTMLGFVVFML